MKDKNESRIVMHIVSLVLGIISILTSLFWYMSIPTGIVAIIVAMFFILFNSLKASF